MYCIVRSSIGWLFLGAILTLIRPTAGLDPSGVNVCSKNESHTTYVQKSRIIRAKESYRDPLCRWLWTNKTCPKYRWVNKIENYTEPVTKTRTIYLCCKGWRQEGYSCPNATCSKYGCRHGRCTAPEVCQCDKGYYGPSCSRVCPSHKYGVGCLYDCRCQNEAKCDSKDGTCECTEGWTGMYCNMSCAPGTFGKNYTQRGSCEFTNVERSCDVRNGTCFCKPGYTGDKCQHKCSNNTYGRNCMYQCECINNSTCTFDTGQCKCTEGYKGIRCEHTCTVGKDCPVKCGCVSGQGRCEPFTAVCSCYPGYNGTLCEHRCPPNSYGPHCTGKCTCYNNATCRVGDGSCDCLDGWTGVSCLEPCLPGTYGKNCQRKCQCKNGAVCDRFDGHCTCTEEWRGIYCHDSNAEGSKNANSRSGPTIAVWHIVVSLISGMVVCIFVIYIVRRSRRRWFERRKLEAKPEKTVDDSIYQDLDLTKMGTEDNYQSLTGNVARISEDAGDDYQNVDVRKTKEQDNGQRLEDGHYQNVDVKKTKKEENQQSLTDNSTRINYVSDGHYQNADIRKTNKENNQQSLTHNHTGIINVEDEHYQNVDVLKMNTKDTHDENSTYTQLEQFRDDENNYQPLT